jgi:D-amino peptidase
MRVFMSLDLEGATGVYSDDQTQPGCPGYEEGCALLLGDTIAAVDGCRAAGATDIVVVDGHHSGSNLSARDLPEDVVLRSGFPGPHSWISGVEPGFDAAVFVAYHAMAGTPGAILDHTYQDGVYSLELDGVGEIGEFGLAAAVCGAYGIPVVFASGDAGLTQEAQATVPGIHTVAVKRGVWHSSGLLTTPQRTASQITDGVRAALSSREWPEPLDWNGRSLRVRFATSDQCDRASACPGARREGGRSVLIPGQDFLAVFAHFLACMELAAAS